MTKNSSCPKIFSIVFSLLLFSSCANKPIPAIEEPALVEEVSPDVFQPGEELSYGIYSGILKTGQSTLTYFGKDPSDQAATVTFETKAFNFYDLETLKGSISSSLPQSVTRKLNIFGSRMNIKEFYLDENRKVSIEHDDSKKNQEIVSDDPIQNVVLMLYGFRNRDLKIGEEFGANFPTIKTKFVVSKIVKIKVPFGTFDAYLIQTDPPKFKIWLQKDGSKLPLRLEGLMGPSMTYLALREVRIKEE